MFCLVAAAPPVRLPPPRQVAPPATLTPGHRRMLETLRRIQDETVDSNNAFLGAGPLNEVTTQLATLTPGVPDLRVWLFHRAAGRHELRLGRPDLAVAHDLEAYRQLGAFPDQIPPDKAAETVFNLAVAYLRLGEVSNCAQRHTADSCILPIRGDGVHALPEGSTQATRYFLETLERSPANSTLAVKARWLLNIAQMTLGKYPDGVPAPWRIYPQAFASEEPFPRFPNIAPRLGIATLNLAGGAIADDFDGDGDFDLMLSSSDTAGPMTYWRNNGDGTFSDRTEAAGLGGELGGLNLVQADYDNDGDGDVLVLRGAWLREFGLHPKSLLRNNGDGTFVDVSYDAGIAEPFFPTQTAAWGDYDNDGDLDLYVGAETSEKVQASNQLFRNNGDGTFRDVAAAAGVLNQRYAKAVVWGDYDGDRFPDLYVSNIGGENRLYHNNRDGSFTDVAPQAGVTLPIGSFPAWFWDFNNDGALDIIVWSYGGAASPPDVADVAASYLDLPHRAELVHLYQGDGRGGFRDVAAACNLKRVLLPMGSNFGDLDNDGWPDMYLGTGYPYYEGLMPNVLYHNRGGRSFADVSTAAGVGNLQKGHGVALADFDGDGDQDVYEEMGGAYPGDGAAAALYQNPGFGNHWIKIKTIGTRSNRAGVGARIRLEVVEGGVRRSIYKTVNSGGSFGASPLLQHLGAGRAERIARLEVYWPASDTTQAFEDVAVDQTLVITEGQERYRRLPAAAARTPESRRAGTDGRRAGSTR